MEINVSNMKKFMEYRETCPRFHPQCPPAIKLLDAEKVSHQELAAVSDRTHFINQNGEIVEVPEEQAEKIKNWVHL